MPTVATPSGNGIASAAQLIPAIVSPSSTAKSTPAARARLPADRAGMRSPAASWIGSRLGPLNTSSRPGRGSRHAQVDVRRRRGSEFDQRPLREATQPFHRRDVLAENQQPRRETVVHASLLDGSDGCQLAQQPVHGRAGQPGFLRQLGDPRAAERTQELQQPERGLDDAGTGVLSPIPFGRNAFQSHYESCPLQPPLGPSISGVAARSASSYIICCVKQMYGGARHFGRARARLSAVARPYRRKHSAAKGTPHGKRNLGDFRPQWPSTCSSICPPAGSATAAPTTTSLWNGAVKRKPALLIRPHSSAEVAAAVLTARSHDLPLSVRGGGQ